MISKEVLMESLRQRETELHKLQDEVLRLRKGIEQAVKLLNTDANTTRELLKEMIE